MTSPTAKGLPNDSAAPIKYFSSCNEQRNEFHYETAEVNYGFHNMNDTSNQEF